MKIDSLKNKQMAGRTIKVTRVLLSTIIFLFVANYGFAKEYQVNSASSMLEWEGKKVTGQHSGTISFAEGTLQVDKNKISGGKVFVDMTTLVNTDGNGVNKNLVGHLKSDDFFSVDKFPQAMLVVKKVDAKSGDLYHFTADLTIKGITAPIEFDAEVVLASGQLTAKGTMTVNRTKYDIKYRSASFFSDLGDKMISDDFTLKFNLVAATK